MSEDFLHYLSGRAERLIRQAQDEGAFDHLPGEGKPLALADDSAVPEELRMAYAVLKNAGYVPPEIADRKEINSLLDLLEGCDDGAETLRQMQKLDVLLMRMNSSRERPVALAENDPYYENVLRRVSLLKRRMRPRSDG